MEALIRYISTERPQELQLLLQSYGVDAQNQEQQMQATIELIQQYGADFLAQLYEFHPDAEYFLEEEQTCPLAKHIPAPVKDFYSGEYQTLKLIATALLAYYIIKKL